MGNEFLAYIERLELMAFFAGYPLVYAIVQVISGRAIKTSAVSRWARLLPYGYALSGTLFFGLLLKELYPDYSVNHIAGAFQNPFLKIWGLTVLLFWLPPFSQRPVFSLLHSVVFFFFLLKDIYAQLTSAPGNEIIQNDMKIYTDSLLLNLLSFALIVAFSLLSGRIIKRSRP